MATTLNYEYKYFYDRLVRVLTTRTIWSSEWFNSNYREHNFRTWNPFHLSRATWKIVSFISIYLWLGLAVRYFTLKSGGSGLCDLQEISKLNSSQLKMWGIYFVYIKFKSFEKTFPKMVYLSQIWMISVKTIKSSIVLLTRVLHIVVEIEKKNIDYLH